MNRLLKQDLDNGGWESIEKKYKVRLSLADRVKLKNYIEQIDPKDVLDLDKCFERFFNEYGYSSRIARGREKYSKNLENFDATRWDLRRQKIYEQLEQEFNVKLEEGDRLRLANYLRRKKHTSFNELWQDAAKLLQRKVFAQERAVRDAKEHPPEKKLLNSEQQRMCDRLEQRFNVELGYVNRCRLLRRLSVREYPSFNKLQQDAANYLRGMGIIQEREAKPKQNRMKKLPKRRIP